MTMHLRKNGTLAAISLCLAGAAAVLGCRETYEFDYLYQELPFDMKKVHRPRIPDRQVLLTDFGAKGDGVTLNTDAFRRAVDSLSSEGGSRLKAEGILSCRRGYGSPDRLRSRTT